MRFVSLIAAASLAGAVLIPCSPSAALPAPSGPLHPATSPRRPVPKPTATPASDEGAVRFRAIGPAMSGGRVAAVAGSDRDPALYYVGGAGGGMFKSVDGGTSFQPAWDGPHFGAIGAVSVAPSTYTARLHVDGRTMEQTFRLADDPQSPWTPAERVARHTFLATAYSWYDALDRALNAIDARMHAASPAERARLTALRARLTSNPLHDEDSIAKPDQIREQVGGFLFALGGALQPPFAQHQAALDALRPDVEGALRDAGNVLGRDFRPAAAAPAIPPAPSPSP